MNPEQVKLLIETDSDFINIKRFEYSLKKLLERYPDGVPTKVICAALQMDEASVLELEQKILSKLKTKLE